jgi:cytochrome P450
LSVLRITAGRDTTAITLTWFFHLISKHPNVEERLMDEINTLNPAEPLTLKNIKQLKYLDNCLSETLRLYPAVPLESRVAVKECVLPSGYTCPAATMVSVSSYFMHRRADLFPDPLRFDPDRWQSQPPHPFAYIPFYGGPQVCLGQSLALAEAKVAIVNLMRRFSFSMAPGFVPEPVKLVVLRAKDGMLMNIKPRQ